MCLAPGILKDRGRVVEFDDDYDFGTSDGSPQAPIESSVLNGLGRVINLDSPGAGQISDRSWLGTP
jgi:hypothetical protein